jgi:hypothetical protein
MVELRPNKLRIKGEGASGWYREVKKLKYSGEPLKFRISPKLLIAISQKHNEAMISSDRLMVNGGKFQFVTCLGKADE